MKTSSEVSFVNSLPSTSRKDVQFRIIKVGGSLFTMPELKNRLTDWARSVAVDRCVDVWIAGGGNFVEEVRNWQALHGLDEVTAHRISIRLLSQTAEIFQSMFLDWPLLADAQLLRSVDPIATPNVVIDCRQWALNNPALKPSWGTTSDSISLQLATGIKASHLFLLKSSSPRSGQIVDAIEDGLIDPNFAVFCGEKPQLKVSITNLRESNKTSELSW